MTGLTGNNAITGAGYRKNQPPYEIDQSLRFNDGDNAYLKRTVSDGNKKTWTWSGWVKKSTLTTGHGIFGTETSGTANFFLMQWTGGGSGDSIFIQGYTSSSETTRLLTERKFRDPSAWYHIVLAVDTTQSTASNRLKLYVNGEHITDFASGSQTYPNSQNLDTAINDSSYPLMVGAYSTGTPDTLDGYLAEVNFIDGQALTPASFGETLASTNQWVPIEYVGSYGTNGFYQKYSTPYGIEAFTTTGSHTWTCPAGVTSVEVLVVGGGGSGGGKYYAGGGGAGGVVHATDYAVTPGVVYDITVGAGGATRSASHVGNDGSNSVFNVNAEGSGITLTATGGGGGGYAAGSNAGDGRDGGSGGGGAQYSTSRQGGSTTQNTYSGTANVTGYGFDGGDGYDNSNNYPAGGGGGAGAVGASSSSSGAGGIGRQFTTFEAYGTDSSNSKGSGDGVGTGKGYFGGGGGGAGYNNPPQSGGAGGGGTSARGDTGVVATAGLANTGGGGGGASHNTTSEGAAGGSGIVLISVDAGLGADSSGNGNNFSATNLVATDVVEDSPTNNFATLNSVFVSPAGPGRESTLTEGNLKATTPTSGSGYNGPAMGTMGMSSGKWYFEWYIGSSNYPAVGIAKPDYTDNYASTNAGNRVWLDGGSLYGASSSSSGVTYTTGDIVGCAVDMDNGKMWFSKNGTFISSGDPAAGTNAQFTDLLSASDMGSTGQVLPFFSDVNWSTSDTVTFNAGQDSSFAGAKTSGAAGSDFYYTPPTGFKALSTDNISDPSIADPTAYFNTLLYTADGTAGRSITGVGFAPDFVWAKERNAVAHHVLVDSVRGTSSGGRLSSNRTNAEDATGGVAIGSFDSDGFTVGSSAGYLNSSTTNYVAWNWKAGGTASTNEDGSITSSVSANTDAGFSIVAWTGTGSNVTVGHGLSQAPELIINKSRGDAYNWAVQSFLWNSASDTNLLYLNTTAAEADDTNVFQAAPTSTVFSPQGGSWAGIGANTIQYIAYCFHSVEGYSKVGSYTGNGSSDGVFIYTGFRPAWFMCKRNSSTNQWTMADSIRSPYNVADDILYANLSDVETTSDAIYFDFVSNGIKLRSGTAGNVNTSGSSYIYLAFAESPFKTSNAR